MSLQKKIKAAEKEIIAAYEKNEGKLFISFSGGKDSTILRHIALRLYLDLKVVFSNTTNELKEVIDYVKTFDNIITVLPKYPFQEVVRRHGFPLVSKEVSQKVNELKNTHGKKTRLLRYYGNNKGNSKLPEKWRYLAEEEFNVTNKCCQILKKDPLNNWAKKEGLKPIIALMAGESRLRSQLSLYGKEDDKKIYPFLRTGWTEEDIWEYAKEYNIRFAECYYDRTINGKLVKARTRTGCEYCMFGIHLEEESRFESSKELTPKRYEKMMQLKNNNTTFIEAMNIVLKEKIKETKILPGNIKKREPEVKNNIEYNYLINKTKTKKCKNCKGTKFSKDISVIDFYLDTPNKETKNKRIIEIENQYYKCDCCGMQTLNDLHMLDINFNVTKRVIDHIYNNIDKKGSFEISTELRISQEKILDILMTYKEKFKIAYENDYKTIWFVD